MQILSYEHTRPLSEEYAKVVLQVATLEERIKVMMSFGLVAEARELNLALIDLLKAVRKDFIDKRK